MNRSIHRERQASRADKEMPVGPSKFWLTVVAILNILVFSGLSYSLLGSE